MSINNTIYYESRPYYPSDELYHHGIKGMRWGIRRYQNPDGTLTATGKRKYGTEENLAKGQTAKHIEFRKKAIATGDAKEILKYTSELTTPQLKDAVSRIENIAKIKAAIPPPKPSVAKKVISAIGGFAADKISKGAKGTAGIGKYFIKAGFGLIKDAVTNTDNVKSDSKDARKQAKQDLKTAVEDIKKEKAKAEAYADAFSNASMDVVEKFMKKRKRVDRIANWLEPYQGWRAKQYEKLSKEYSSYKEAIDRVVNEKYK